jgi:hypothetical protein
MMWLEALLTAATRPCHSRQMERRQEDLLIARDDNADGEDDGGLVVKHGAAQLKPLEPDCSRGGKGREERIARSALY